MDRVPILFIKEVLLQLEQPCHVKEIPQYPSTWGKVASRKVVRKPAELEVYYAANKEPVFFLRTSGPSSPLALEDLEQFALESIAIRKKRYFDDIYTLPYPLTKANIQLLQKHLQRGHPCRLLSVDVNGLPLLKQLCCLAPSRITHIYVKKNQPLPTEVLTQSVERGTLCHLNCAYSINMTQDTFMVLKKFVASKNFDSLILTTFHGSLSEVTFIEGVVDAFLSRPRRQQFNFFASEHYEKLCGLLEEQAKQDKVDVYYSSAFLKLCPISFFTT
uniref:Mitochondrial ribonuclease P protein 1 n=1 Tax=Steinernema glaseri TaxID=37863 RepID=A0A1I8A4Z9_9BILA